MRFKKSRFGPRLVAAARSGRHYRDVHVFIGGTGAVGGAAALQMVAMLEEMMTIAPPASPDDVPVLIVTGRTDDRKTGSFAAWRLVGSRLQALWSSELLEHSSYEAKDGVLRIDFCSENDEEKPSVCKKMTRERYAWNAGWIRLLQEDITPK